MLALRAGGAIQRGLARCGRPAATLSTPLIAKLGTAHVGEVNPVSEIMPRMVEPVM